MPKVQTLCLLLFVLAVSLARADDPAAEPEEVPIYTYHNGGPFIVEDSQGLTFELSRYLAKESEGRWVFPVVQYPRLRFNKVISNKKLGIIPWVQPVWLKKLNLKDNLWSYPYFKDSNVIVSNSNNKIVYTGPESLFGYTVVKIKGSIQVGIDPYIVQGKIREVNSINFEGHLQMVYAKRADFVSTSLSIANYKIPNLGLEGKLYISMRPIDVFSRQITVLGGREDILLFLNDTIKKMATDPEWIAAMAKFGTAEQRVTEFAKIN